MQFQIDFYNRKSIIAILSIYNGTDEPFALFKPVVLYNGLESGAIYMREKLGDYFRVKYICQKSYEYYKKSKEKYIVLPLNETYKKEINLADYCYFKEFKGAMRASFIIHLTYVDPITFQRLEEFNDHEQLRPMIIPISNNDDFLTDVEFEVR